MHEILTIISITLYFLVGVIALLMAIKNLFSKKFLPFHEEAYGKKWDEIDPNLKLIILSILKVSGLGFLVVAILLFVFPVVNYFNPDRFVKYAIPLISLIYCTGLFLVNYHLCKKTNAKTPWKGSLYAMFIIIAGLILSLI